MPNLTCQHCGKTFWSKSRIKKFCDLKCYKSSDFCREHLKRLAASGHPIAAANRRARREELVCLQCGPTGKMLAPAHRRRRKFCSQKCLRLYYNARFDSFIGTIEGMPLPQNYDEFLTREELSCLIPGCDWAGKNLALHVSYAHGISAERFKEMVGFNRRTGLVCLPVHEAASERAAARPDLPQLLEALQDGAKGAREVGANYNPPLRLEGREHMVKARTGRPGHQWTEEERQDLSEVQRGMKPPKYKRS